MATCPKCSDTGLRHTLVAGSLPANSCNRCKGVLVSLVAYRDWRERSGVAARANGDTSSATKVEDTKEALLCGKCQHVMTKFRVSADSANKIDFCLSCDEVWLDSGEWEVIEALVGSGELSKITTQPWQYRVMADSIERMELARLKEDFGEDFEKVVELGKILDDHPARLEILAYLSGKSR